MQKLNEQNQRLLDDNEQYKQVNTQLGIYKDNITLKAIYKNNGL